VSPRVLAPVASSPSSGRRRVRCRSRWRPGSGCGAARAVERPGAGQPRVEEGAGGERPGSGEGQQHPWRHGPGMQQQPQPVEGLDAGDPLIRHIGWQPDVEVQTKRGGDLLGEEAPEGALRGIGARDQLGGDPPGGEVVVALAGPGRPLGPLAGDERGQPVLIGQVDQPQALVDGGEPDLVGQDLPDRDRRLAGLGELRPVGDHGGVVVQQSAGVRDGQGGGGHALGHAEDQDQGVLTPRQSAVAQAAPQVHDRLAVPVYRAGRAQLTTLGEVVHEGLLDRLEPGATHPWRWSRGMVSARRRMAIPSPTGAHGPTVCQ
jgi:hypothetical protein